MSPEPERAPDDAGAAAPPRSSAPWLSTQHEMETAARPVRSRLVKVRLGPGTWRIGNVSFVHAALQSPTDGRREHLYRVALEWVAEFDTRDGRAVKLADRASANRASNSLQFRVLESTAPDGRHVALARLGPKGRIAAEPRGLGVMGYLRAVLVDWVAAAHPDAAVLQGSLALPDLQPPAELARRDAFFVRAGFVVTTTADGGGRYDAASLRELKTGWNTEKVIELTPAMLAEALSHEAQLPLLQQQVAGLQDQARGLERERRAAEIMARVWIAITVLAIVFGIAFGIQPRVS